MQPHIEGIRRIYKPTDEDNKWAEFTAHARMPYSRRIAFLTGVNHPKHWRLCPRCKGKFTARPGMNPCAGCEGYGFESTHVGDKSQYESVTDDD